MNLRKVVFALIALLVGVSFTLIESMMTVEIMAIVLFVYFLIDFIDSIGKNYNILDIPILLALFQCMLMPAVIYHIYNNDALVIALNYNMGVSSQFYYGFMFPAIVAMIIGMKLPPLFQLSYQRKFLIAIDTVKRYLVGKGNLGVLLVSIGVVTTIMKSFIGGQLQYIAYLFSLLLYVGVLYTFFSDHKQRMLYLVGGFVIIFAQAIAQGMFGELVYVFLLAVLLMMLGKKLSTSLKFTLAIIGFIAVILLQSIKADYRAITWGGEDKEEQNKTEAFFTLIANRLTEPGRFFDLDLMFPTVNRFNQGMIVSKVLEHVPNRAPFAEGETIFSSLAATFVPRVLWPDKPKAGGHYNMERFAGLKIDGYSMNISPMGEAYGNFGVEGGIAFMLGYGLFFSILIVILMNYVRKKPTLILWFPILFLNSVQIETDILMCLNSLIKNILFVSFCYWAADRFLKLKL